MAEKILEIQSRYRQYRILLNCQKTSQCNPLLTTLDSKGHPTESTETPLTHPVGYERISLRASIKSLDPGDYELKLFWRGITSTPVLRFESRGDGHFNPGDRLRSRKIPNPHFHKVREDGTVIAFRTPLLEDPEQEKHIRQHYSFGLKHFCQEARIQDSNGADLNVQMVSAMLSLSTTYDPLEGVTF